MNPLIMEEKKRLRTPLPYTIRDKAEIAVIIILIAGGFAAIVQYTSPSFIHTHLTNYTWWQLHATKLNSWVKVHTSAFDQFDQEDFHNDLILDGIDLAEQDRYQVESLAAKLKEVNYERIEIKKNKGYGFEEISKVLVHEHTDIQNMEQQVSAAAKPCDAVPENERFDCNPERTADEIVCWIRNCCWRRPSQDRNLSMGVPYCYYPKNYEGYTVEKSEDGENENGNTEYKISLTREKKSYYPDVIKELLMEVTLESDYRLRVKISDANNSRWEVPVSGSMLQGQRSDSGTLYSVQRPAVGQPFSLAVSRLATNTTILNTTGAFLYNDQFLQLSFLLPSTNIYGLGEHRDSLRHSFNWTKFVFWNKDQPPVEDSNLYGSHPFYLMVEDDGNSHGVMLLNSNAMEVILQPSPAITWRTIGGVLDFYIFLGPTPSDVIRQYTEVIGRTFMPPYWSLGFHQCRWGYTTAAVTQAMADNLTRVGMPQDVQWNDIDYMDEKRDFTTSFMYGNQSGLVEKLHSQGKHYIMIVDPGISNTNPGPYEPYDLGLSMNIFINNSDGKPLEGVVWPGTTVFPDFTNPDTQQYWTTLVKHFHDSVAFDGMWIDMNEISNFVAGSTKGCPVLNKYETPPYVPGVKGNSLHFSTICASAQQYLGPTYNVHNLYGLGESNASYNALISVRPNRRPLVISRSTFPGQGQFGGHWTGDNAATFYDMYKSISDILSFNMFGIPMVGADICGFREATNKALCQRWYQLGAFYPFSRSHNDHKMPDQDPTAFGADLLQSTISAYTMRYSLLPYLYTLFYRSHVDGDTVARPLFFQFPLDKATYSIDKQFLWGSALMILPVLDQDFRVEAYFPKDTWFSFNNGSRITDTGGSLTLSSPLNTINLCVRGGSILPMQQTDLTTTLSRKKPFWLLVALNQSLGASGELYWDDGDSLDSYSSGSYNLLEFTAANKTVTSAVVHGDYTSEQMSLGNVTVLGVLSPPSSVTLNGNNTTFKYNTNNQALYVTDITVDLLKTFTLSWN